MTGLLYVIIFSMITESERKELTVLVAEDFKRHQYDEPKDRARVFLTADEIRELEQLPSEAESYCDPKVSTEDYMHIFNRTSELVSIAGQREFVFMTKQLERMDKLSLLERHKVKLYFGELSDPYPLIGGIGHT
jgi:hypothetical protein